VGVFVIEGVTAIPSERWCPMNTVHMPGAFFCLSLSRGFARAWPRGTCVMNTPIERRPPTRCSNCHTVVCLLQVLAGGAVHVCH